MKATYVKADQPAPECRLPEPFVKLETERLGKPVGVAGERAEQHAADDDVVEMPRPGNRLLCSTKATGGHPPISTPVMPPMMNVTMKPIDHNSGV